MNRPSLVSRSKFSVSDLIVTPRSRSSPTVVSTWAAERPHRSDFQNTRVSPACKEVRAGRTPAAQCRACRTLSRRTAGHSRARAGHQAAAAGSDLARRPGSRRWCGPPAASVRERLPSRTPWLPARTLSANLRPGRPPGLGKGFVLALSRIKLSCIRRWVTAPRAKSGARAERQPHSARTGPRRCVCLRTVRLDRGQHGVHHRPGHWQPGIGNQSLQMRAEWV